MTKTDRIKALIAKGLTNRGIALKTGYSEAYVRAIRNRVRNLNRYGTIHSPTEVEAARRRYQDDPETRRKICERSNRWYRENQERVRENKRRYRTRKQLEAILSA